MGTSNLVPCKSGTGRGDPAHVGGIIAGRYRLTERLGRGGNSRVYRAEDLLTDGQVALKLLPRLEDHELIRLRSEVSALRMLHLPGVARLFDEGQDGDRPFLALELAHGRNFPGQDGPVTWYELRGVVVALLEILARVHATGVVHRDLKPANVLVDGSGRPTVLDFGLSAGRAIGSGLDPDRSAVGTPAYAAPEQILGDPADARSDLYSLGVMIYEVLAGRLPQSGKGADEIMQNRLSQPPVRLRELVPDLPPTVAEIVDSLIARDPSQRPRSAIDVLASLRGEETLLAAEQELPLLGREGHCHRLIELARTGRSADLVGGRGSGRSRCLDEVGDRLEREGRSCVSIAAEDEPLGSLRLLAGWQDDPTALSLDAAMEHMERHLLELLAGGFVLLVDDFELLDKWSARLLQRCRRAGCVIVAHTSEPRADDPVVEVIHLNDLRESELHPLFAGPERVFHLPEDGARELWRRTQGNPARVANEIAAWVRAGLAQWVGVELAVDRQSLDRLRTGLQVLPPEVGRRDSVPLLSQNLQEHLAWLSLAGPHASSTLLAKLRNQPAWMVEAEHLELLGANAARRTAEGRLEVLVSPRQLLSWGDEERREAHTRIADVLEPGTPGRLFHLVSAGEFSAVPAEACELARSLVRTGRLGEAEATLTEGLHAVRVQADAVGERRIFREWIHVALADFTPLALDRLLYELSRAIERGEELVHLEQVVHAAVATLGTDGERALAEVEAVPPFEAENIERWRQGLRVLAARSCSAEREEEVLEDIATWARGCRSRDVHASLAEWMGRLRYRQDRFLEAAELQARSARMAERLSARLSAMLNGASALLEACRFYEVIELATRARELAAECRHPLFEVRAEWLLRAADYRREATLEPDLELTQVAGQVGVPDQEALICLTEAAIAWRAGELDLARELAEATAASWAAAGKIWGGILARALALASGARPEEGEVEELTLRAEECPQADVAGQSLGLLRRSGARPNVAWREVAARIRAEIPPHLWPTRREVLSISEVLAALESSA